MLTEEQRAAGWIEHDGGPCPVDDDALAEVMFSDGETDMIYAAFWSAPGPDMDDNWTGDCAPDDRIIAYRKETPDA